MRLTSLALALTFQIACQPPPARVVHDPGAADRELKRALLANEAAKKADDLEIQRRLDEADRERPAIVAPPPVYQVRSAPAQEAELGRRAEQMDKGIWRPSDGDSSPCCKGHEGVRGCFYELDAPNMRRLQVVRCVDGTQSRCGC